MKKLLFLLMFVGSINLNAQKIEKKYNDIHSEYCYLYQDYDFNKSVYVKCDPINEGSYKLFQDAMRTVYSQVLKPHLKVIPPKIVLVVYFDQHGNFIKIDLSTKNEYYKDLPEDKVLEFFKGVKDKVRPFDFASIKDIDHELYYSQLTMWLEFEKVSK